MRCSIAVIPVAVCMLLSACASKDGSSRMPATQRDEQMASMQVEDRVKTMADDVEQFSKLAEQLPGSGASDREAADANRQLTRQCFETLTKLLPLIEGPNQTGDFRQGMRVLDTSRQQLSNPTITYNEPTIAQGVRALGRLLVSLNTYVFNNDPTIAAKNEAAMKTIDQLDLMHGIGSRTLAARAMRESAESIKLMSDNLAGRLAPATQPTSQPAK